MSSPAARVAQMYVEACRLDVMALKPGNVGVHAEGHGMQVRDFERSAEASAVPMSDPRLSLGERMFRAVQVTRDSVGCNTNLGIVLLCAPIAQAYLQGSQESGLRTAVAGVLATADVRDANGMFKAIRLASPGGLGSVGEHDVQAEASVGVVEAMRHAPASDGIARCYAEDFAPVFDVCLPVLQAAGRHWRNAAWAASGLYMHMLSRWPDGHIVRKQGLQQAESVRARAEGLWRSWSQVDDPAQLIPPMMAFDADLKASGLNPGTTADLTVGSLFTARLMGFSGPAFEGVV